MVEARAAERGFLFWAARDYSVQVTALLFFYFFSISPLFFFFNLNCFISSGCLFFPYLFIAMSLPHIVCLCFVLKIYCLYLLVCLSHSLTDSWTLPHFLTYSLFLTQSLPPAPGLALPSHQGLFRGSAQRGGRASLRAKRRVKWPPNRRVLREWEDWWRVCMCEALHWK